MYIITVGKLQPATLPGAFAFNNSTPASGSTKYLNYAGETFSVTVYWTASSGATSYELSVTAGSNVAYVSSGEQTGLTGAQATFYISPTSSGPPAYCGVTISMLARNANGTTAITDDEWEWYCNLQINEA